MRELSEMVAAEGFSRGTIVANSNFLGAHLALRFPEARVISLDAGYYQPPHRAPAGECLLVWNADHGLQPPPQLRDYVVHTLGTPLPVDATTQVLTAPLYGSDKQVYRLAQLRFTPSAGECR
jgi:hypothetical protein